MEELAQTENCIVALGPAAPSDSLQPIGAVETDIMGLRLYARSAIAYEAVAAEFAGGDAALEFRAITPTPIWSEGSLEEEYAGAAAFTRFRVVATRGELSELSVTARPGGSKQIRFHLARAGIPVLGEARHGGGEVAGGVRLRAARVVVPSEEIDVSVDEPEDFWPLGTGAGKPASRPVLVVSHATASVLRRGHPWILPDADTSDVARLRPGSLAEVRNLHDKPLGLARIEGRGRITARMWSRSKRRDEVASVETRVTAALARRRRLLGSERIEALRLIHGEADALPGLFVDRFGPLLRLLLTSRACETIQERVLNALHGPLAGVLGQDPPVVRVVHLAEPPPGRLRCVELVRGNLDGLLDDSGRLVVREDALRFQVDPGLGSPERTRPGTGLFIDQRDNRARVAKLARGGRWLNLFSHTGAFSVAALAGGAEAVVSVDLSAPYLKQLEANLTLNDLDVSRHRSVHGDARRYLERLDTDDRFDGIVCDPPTAARAGQRFWSVRRGGGELLARCLERLRPGGSLLVCRNDHGARGSLEPLLRDVAHSGRIILESVKPASAGLDFPHLAAFPEGDAFEGVLAKLA